MIDEDELAIIDGLQPTQDIVSKGEAHPSFSSRINNYGQINMTQDELARLQQSIVDSEENSKVLPELFADPSLQTRQLKAQTCNLFYEYEGDWSAMSRDPRCPSSETLRRYWLDERFRACIKAFDEVLTLRAKSVVSKLMLNENAPPMVQLEAATRWLRANDANTWDPGVRKQIVANKGTLANSFFNKAISEKDVLESLVHDPFSKVPQNIRNQLAEAIGEEPKQLEAQSLPIHDAPVISHIMPDDPFGAPGSNNIKKEEQ